MIKNIADRIFQWYCDPGFYPDIKGDLEELYDRNSKRSVKYANWKYLLQVIGLFRPSIIRSFHQISIINQSMFRNYFKTGTRNLLHHKLYTSINVIGLAIGLVSFLLINEYVNFEKSYDSFFENAGQIYRLSTVQIDNGVVGTKDAMTFQPAAQAIANELPEVLFQTTTLKFDEIIIRKDHEVFKEKKVISADSNFLKVFSHQVLQGSATTMLNEPNTLVLTKSKARFYFGDENPLGKTLEILGSFNRTFKITGVIEDIPDNTHYKFNMIISDKSIVDRGDYNNWNAYNYYAFLVLDKDTDLSTLQEKLDIISKKYKQDTDLHFSLFPIQDIHLKSDFTYEPEIPGNETTVSILMIISIFILIIAWVNYINLSTARAVERAKEVGLRKVIGAYKIQIIIQFLFESFIVNLVAVVFAFFMAELTLGYFHQIINTTMTDHIWNDPSFMKNLLIFFAIGTVVSGFYPALVLSGFKPVSVLKGKFNNSKHGILLRRGLVVLQFSTSIVLIAGTFTISKQVKFMRSKDLGITIDYVIGFYMPEVEDARNEENRERINTFKEELRNHTAIDEVGATSNLPGGDGSDINSNSGKIRIVGITEPLLGTVYIQFNDDHFMDAVNMQLVAGRDFDRTIKSDSNAVMVNEAFLGRFNISDPDSVLNEFIIFGENEENTKYNIVGIVKDFHRTSLKSVVEPTLYFPSMDASGILVKLDPDKYQDGIAFIETKWKELFADSPFDYSFLDDRFAKLYQQDRRFSEVFLVFSILAIFIATLGLFGLSSFMAVQRTKEVGIRKVLGATIKNIIFIFYKDFLILLGIAAIIGLPVVYFSMNFWLENYAFRIAFPWILSLLSVIIVIIFALITVGFQTFKVAILNPVNSLKYE